MSYNCKVADSVRGEVGEFEGQEIPVLRGSTIEGRKRSLSALFSSVLLSAGGA